jgi:hypothetical protein
VKFLVGFRVHVFFFCHMREEKAISGVRLRPF